MDTAILYINILPSISFIITLTFFVRKKIFFTEKKLVCFLVKCGVVFLFSWLFLILSTLSFLIILFATVCLLDFGVIAVAVMWFWLTRKPKKKKNGLENKRLFRLMENH
ncbi:hypothetical protein [Enterococcus faecium]|uniref:hypothetical protein n=1 Tax=Enterococcus faecium TaxID=1352 RepID=UPI0002825E7F|nr:hypothetical protein [Enterococcus faecium]EJX88529.1 hypothetical protein HMPREF1368_00284 [Enterococcus faecium ERV69]EJX91256.1 hypothetical protein HMPREF1367_00804 [Enterococcus faecium ERV38]RCT57330.1 hypothetical protein B1133_17120 [Enterococcus faecium]RCT57370.1 hypothetical protein B1139_14950 [Enterococcus faecium]